MAARFEIFNKLREFGNSLDKTSALSCLNDDEPEQNSKARACLQLRAILAETKILKEDAKKNIDAMKKRVSFDEFLVVCEKQAEKMKEDIENLEEHLVKYGYQRPKEKLPEVQMDSFDNADEHAGSTSGQSESSGSPRFNSDKENQPLEPEEIDIAEEKDVKEGTNTMKDLDQGIQDPDLLLTPVQPKTFTKFLQDSWVRKEADPTHTPEIKDPLPPGTTMPLVMLGKSLVGNGVETPETLSELPAQPATRTPMIKASRSFVESPAPEATQMNESPTDDFPTPPTFTTPGLQRHGGETQVPGHIQIATPPQPCFSSVDMLNPDDSPSMLTAGDIASNTTESSAEHGVVKLPNIDKEAFLGLPKCLQQQFSLQQVNHLIRKTNEYLVSRIGGDSGLVSDEQLMSALNLGPMTRTFMLVMIKLSYLTIVRKGLYKVLL